MCQTRRQTVNLTVFFCLQFADACLTSLKNNHAVQLFGGRPAEFCVFLKQRILLFNQSI
jgi:hypothetical protein